MAVGGWQWWLVGWWLVGCIYIDFYKKRNKKIIKNKKRFS
jgi:hypothetical protein